MLLLAERYLEHFDGMSIGSNDMTQLTLGLDATPRSWPGRSTSATTRVKALLSLAIKACRKQGKYIGIWARAVGSPGLRALARRAGHRQPVPEPGHRARYVAHAGRAAAPVRRAGVSATTRTVCFVSDRTGVTAEVLGHSLLSLFAGMTFDSFTMPFVLDKAQARGSVARINALGTEQHSQPDRVLHGRRSGDARRDQGGAGVVYRQCFRS